MYVTNMMSVNAYKLSEPLSHGEASVASTTNISNTNGFRETAADHTVEPRIARYGMAAPLKLALNSRVHTLKQLFL